MRAGKQIITVQCITFNNRGMCKGQSDCHSLNALGKALLLGTLEMSFVG